MRNRFIVSPFFLDVELPPFEHFAHPDWFVNRPLFDSHDRFIRMSRINDAIAQFVASACDRGERPVSIAGDCCTAIGVLAGLQRAGIHPRLLWLDAHGDFNTYETSPSGFIGGMPLAMIVGRGDQTLVQAAGLIPLPESDVILSDARDLNPEEGIAVQTSRIRHVKNVKALPQQITKSALYVHLDVDVLDPQDAPAMLYPVPGGPSLEQLGATLKSLVAMQNIVAVSVTVWDFKQDADKKTEQACMQLLHELIGDEK
jgi:arginase